MKKLKLHENELEVIGQIRHEDTLYSLYYYALGENGRFDSGFDYSKGFSFSDWDWDWDVLNSSFSCMENSFKTLNPPDDLIINCEYYGDLYGSTYFVYSIYGFPYVLIDFINLSWLSLVIHWEESKGEDEVIIEAINKNLNKAFYSFIENGVFKFQD